MASGVVVSGNSTTTPLASGATFTGSWQNCSFFSSLAFTCLTDKDGSLYVDFSPDGSNADSTLTYKVTASVTEVHRLVCTRQFFRIRFTNTAATSQTYIRLQAILGEYTLLSSPLNLAIQQDADAIVVRAVDYEFDIAAGRATGVEIVNKFGRNADVDTASVPEDVWESGGAYTGFPTGSAETVSVVSTSVNDASAGSGARTIRIIGLDANYAVQSETITLNGTTPVTSVNTYIRVHTASIQSSGSSNQAFNAGIISVYHTTTTANIFLAMAVGTNQTNSSGYTVPAGKTAYMRRLHVSAADGAATTIQGAIWARLFGVPPRLRRPFSVQTGNRLDDIIYGGLSFPEKTDLILRITVSSANNVVVAAGYDLILVDN